MNTTTIPAHVAAYSDYILAYIAIAMVIGIIGNAIVLYAFKTEASGFNTLVTVLAVFDILACFVHMPLDIVSLYDPYAFPEMTACKITCFMISFTAIGSAILLVAIATMRFKAVCRPHSPNLSTKATKIISAIAFSAAILLSWPIFLIFGVTTIQQDNTVYAFCGVQNAYMMTVYPLLFYYILGSLFLVDFTVLCFLYFLTGRELLKRRKVFASHSVKPPSLETEVNQRETPVDVTTGTKGDKLQESHSPQNTTMSVKKKTKDKKSQKSFFMMSLVSVVFFLSYMPHLFLVYYFMAINMAAFPANALTPWFGMLMRSFYINNVADPFIYGFFSNEFRKNVNDLPRKLGNLCKK